MDLSLYERRGLYVIIAKSGVDKLIRIDYHGSREVPTGTCEAILKAAGLKQKRK
jgi:predicted RNA binding protein YcfA (HicA-like mRNA interferase family)